MKNEVKKEKIEITREQADEIIREFRRDCLPFGVYPDYVIINFLNNKFDHENK